MSGAAAGGAAAAAAAKRARMRQEEESMTSYSPNDLEGWEFKIVRANTRRFKDREAIRQLCEEESKAGWEMIEKFDDTRIRFKRKIENRSRDQHLDMDPYRSEVGFSQGALAGVIIGIVLLVGGLAALFTVIAK